MRKLDLRGNVSMCSDITKLEVDVHTMLLEKTTRYQLKPVWVGVLEPTYNSVSQIRKFFNYINHSKWI